MPENDFDDLSCPICYLLYSETNTPMLHTACFQRFCKVCYEEMRARGHTRCPICREEMPETVCREDRNFLQMALRLIQNLFALGPDNAEAYRRRKEQDYQTLFGKLKPNLQTVHNLRELIIKCYKEAIRSNDIWTKVEGVFVALKGISTVAILTPASPIAIIATPILALLDLIQKGIGSHLKGEIVFRLKDAIDEHDRLCNDLSLKLLFDEYEAMKNAQVNAKFYGQKSSLDTSESLMIGCKVLNLGMTGFASYQAFQGTSKEVGENLAKTNISGGKVLNSAQKVSNLTKGFVVAGYAVELGFFFYGISQKNKQKKEILKHIQKVEDSLENLKRLIDESEKMAQSNDEENGNADDSTNVEISGLL